LTPVAPHIVNNVSYVTRINHEFYFVVQCSYFVAQSSTGVVLEEYFSVRSSTGVLLCGTLYVLQSSTGVVLVVRSSTGVVLCSTEKYWSSME